MLEEVLGVLVLSMFKDRSDDAGVDGASYECPLIHVFALVERPYGTCRWNGADATTVERGRFWGDAMEGLVDFRDARLAR